MLRSITVMVVQIIDAAGSVVGYRHGTEEPAHSTQKLTSDVEIRRYGARVAAGRLDFCDSAFRSGLIDIGDHHVGAFACHGQGTGASDARTSAGDDGHFVLQNTHLQGLSV